VPFISQKVAKESPTTSIKWNGSQQTAVAPDFVLRLGSYQLKGWLYAQWVNLRTAREQAFHSFFTSPDPGRLLVKNLKTVRLKGALHDLLILVPTHAEFK
jgi:hypothetical protein